MNLSAFIKNLPLYSALICSMTTFTPCIAENTQAIKTLIDEKNVDSDNASPKKQARCGCKKSFKHFKESVTINITMTIPQLAGPVPPGGNFDVTPFAIGPDGKIFRGLATNIIPSNGLVQALNPVPIPHPLKGNYVVGYFVSLGNSSPTFSTATLANFSGVILNNPVGDLFQSITIPVQTLFLGSLTTAADVLTITANFPIVRK